MNKEQEAINYLAKLARRLANANQEGLDRGDYKLIESYVKGKIDAYNFIADCIQEYAKEDVNND